MYLTDEEQKLFEESVVLSANKLLPSKVTVDADELTAFSADCYATIGALDDHAYLHFRLFDGTSEEFDPSFSYGEKKISEINLQFEQVGDEDEHQFVYSTEDARIIFTDGEEESIKPLSDIGGLPLIFAAKVMLVDIVRIITSPEKSDYSLNP